MSDCNAKRLRSKTAADVWEAIGNTCLTTRRILRDFNWLQNATQAARLRQNFDEAKRELGRIGQDLIGPDWIYFDDGEGGDSGGFGGDDGVSPIAPTGPVTTPSPLSTRLEFPPTDKANRLIPKLLTVG
jgi:hypothetical protein